MRRAFVSHSTADDSYVAELESFLRAAGFDDVFNDVSAIRPDEQFWPEIEKGIADCDRLFVVITAASNASDWVTREVECARGLGKKVIPLWVEDCPVPAIFQDRDVIDLRRRTRELLRTDISRIFKYAPSELIGREDEKRRLSEAWAKALRAEVGRPNVLTFVALGGEGKTSLVAKWVVDEMSAKGWPGCAAAFAWSFYSQGTREQVAASSDLFLKEALTFFGDHADKEFAASPAGAYEKGQRLARIVGQRRSLLILDGLEPLQYAPTSPTPRQLKDQGIAALLRALAAASHGLCVVTTRYSLPDLRAFWQTTAPEEKLMRLSRDAGVHLLQSCGVKGSLLRNLPFHREQVNEFEKLVEDVQGHALTLNLLGTYLRDAHAGDIRKRDLVNLGDATEEQGGHAFRVMEAYEREFEREGEKGQRALAVLRLHGLFDRPLTSDCLGALLQAPAIPGLTEPLIGLTEAHRNLAFKRLEDARLLTVNRDASGALDTLDAHPLLREYFAVRVRDGALWSSFFRKSLHRVFSRISATTPAWRAAHQRLYEHLCKTAPESTKADLSQLMQMLGMKPCNEKQEPTIEDLQPLYQAVAHGCNAGLQHLACGMVYRDRILGKTQDYSWRKLGAFSSDLGVLACFFDLPWNDVSPELSEADQAWLLSCAAFNLRALGRLTEALEPTRGTVMMRVRQESWLNAAISAGNLSELDLTLGDVTAAVRVGKEAVGYADRSANAFRKMGMRTTYGDALYQAGNQTEAEACFRAAEKMQAENEPAWPLLYSLQGFRFCDLLLSRAERAAWRLTVELSRSRQKSVCPSTLPASCCAVAKRAAQTLGWWENAQKDLLSIPLDHLTLGRVALYSAILECEYDEPSLRLGEDQRQIATTKLKAAVAGIRRSNLVTCLPLALLTRAWRFLTGQRAGSESAQTDLDEAWEIAERGPMRLHMADIHLHRARLFFREAQYPWESPQADLAAAEKLINECGYHRRDEELADAKAAILTK